MGQYYYVGTLFQAYHLKAPAEMTFDEVVYLLKKNMSHTDYEKVKVIRRYYDIENLRRFWKDEEFDPYGNLDENEMEEALLTKNSNLPEYVYEYIEKYDDDEKRIKNFSELMGAYFREEIKKADGFLKQFLEFERDFRLTMVGFRAKERGRDVVQELQFENPYEDIIAQILAQKDAPKFEPPEQFADLKQILMDEKNNSPLHLHKDLLEYRFRKYEEMVGLDIFSTDRILAYFVEHILTEKWFALNKRRGQDIVEKIVEGKP